MTLPKRKIVLVLVLVLALASLLALLAVIFLIAHYTSREQSTIPSDAKAYATAKESLTAAQKAEHLNHLHFFPATAYNQAGERLFPYYQKLGKQLTFGAIVLIKNNQKYYAIDQIGAMNEVRLTIGSAIGFSLTTPAGYHYKLYLACKRDSSSYTWSNGTHVVHSHSLPYLGTTYLREMTYPQKK